MTKLTGGQVLVQSLENRGVKTIFGMPGINILHIHIAKEAHGFSRGRMSNLLSYHCCKFLSATFTSFNSICKLWLRGAGILVRIGVG